MASPKGVRMSAMSDQPVTLAVLAQFHRDVVLPDVERVVGALERRMDARFNAHLDAIYQRFDRLEAEYQMVVVGLRRVEEGLDRVEERIGGLDARVGMLEAGYRDLLAMVHRLDERLSRVERALDELVTAQQRYALESEVRQLRARLDTVEAQVDALRQRLET
jgi:chromosome segregation ATPase